MSGAGMVLLQILIPTLYMLCFGGLTYVIITAVQSGQEAYGEEYSANAARQFEDMFLFIPPRRINQLRLAGAISGFMLTFLALCDFVSAQGTLVAALFGLVVGAAATFIPHALLIYVRHKRLQKFNDQLVDSLMIMSNALKAGFSIMQAFESVVRTNINPIAQEFSVMLQQIRLGVSFQDGMNNMTKRVKSDDLALVVMSIETARQTGGNLTEVFDTIAHTIRERMRIERRIQTLTAQGRMQGIIISSLPVFLGVMLYLWKPELMVPFLHSKVGIISIVIVSINLLIGGLLIRKIIRIDV